MFNLIFSKKIFRKIIMADPIKSLVSNPPKKDLSTKQQQRNAKIGMGFLLQQIRSSATKQSSSICLDGPLEKKSKEEDNEIDHQKPSTSSTNLLPVRIIRDGKTRPNCDLRTDKEFYNKLAPVQVISDCFRQGTIPDFGPVISRYIGENNYVRSCKWSPDGKWLIADSVDHFVRIFAYSNDKLSFHLKLPFGGIVYDHQWSPNVTKLQFATTSQGQPIHCWAPDGGELICSFRGVNDQDELDSAYSICYSLDDRQLFAGYRNRLRIFDLERPGRQIRDIKTFQKGTVMAAQKGICSALAICPTFDGVFAVSTYSGLIGLYSTHTNTCDCLIGGNDGSAITHLQYSAGGNMVFAGYRQNPLIKCFDIRMPTRLLATYLRSAQTSQRFYFELDPHDRYLYTGSSRGELLIYELENGHKNATEGMSSIEANYRIKCSQAAVTGLSLHPDDQLVAISTGQRLFPSDFLSSCLFADQSPTKDDEEKKEEENFSYADLGKDASSFFDNSIKLYRMNSSNS